MACVAKVPGIYQQALQALDNIHVTLGARFQKVLYCSRRAGPGDQISRKSKTKLQSASISSELSKGGLTFARNHCTVCCFEGKVSWRVGVSHYHDRCAGLSSMRGRFPTQYFATDNASSDLMNLTCCSSAFNA